MLNLRILASLTFFLLAISCGSSAPGATAVLDATLAPTIAPLPVIDPPPPIDLADYRKYDKVSHLLEGLGPERPFPPELLDSALPLPKEEAASLWKQFLSGTRAVQLKIGEVQGVTDYCDRTATNQWEFDPWLVGVHFAWDVRPTEFAEWNEPRLLHPNPGGRDRASFLRRGDYSGVFRSLKLLPPEDGGRPRQSSVRIGERELVVFDHPQCVEIPPLKEFSATQFDLLGIDEFFLITDSIKPEDPQLPRDELLRIWDDHTSDITAFFNLMGTPLLIMCADGTGIDVGRYSEKNLHGKTFTWHNEDARDVAKNAIWVDLTYEHGEQVRYLVDVEQHLDPYIAFMVVRNPGCSIEEGLTYLETVEVPE